MQLDFPSKGETLEFLENAKMSWSIWFSSLTHWKAGRQQEKRLAWLEIFGLPLHVWNLDWVAKIGRIWGEVVRSEIEGDNGIRKIAGRVTILTENMDWIMARSRP